MRSGGCSVQQSLTHEAANMVKQAMALARRRGHAQVTPLHVASTMLSSSTGLLRTACLQSNTHPLQCRALELCFNVSLNRLPTSTGSPMLVPCISNALVAAFKRAQAHLRRGCLDNHQQPILAVKIELDQLVVSILDDPGVSRVMREAGFSSPYVKSKVEQSLKCSTMKEAEDKTSSKVISTLPPWLQKYKNENQPVGTDLDNSICDSLYVRPSEKTLDLSSLSPSSSSNTYAPTREVEYASRFNEMNTENLETLCDALRSKAQKYKDAIPDLAKAILSCRSRSEPRCGCWLLFQGEDVEAKEKIGRELADIVFGSQKSFVSISLRDKKRKRDEDSLSYTQRLFEAVSCNPHRVFFVEDRGEADHFCQMDFKKAIERGRVQGVNGEEALLRDAIVILCCERVISRSRSCSPHEGERKMRSSSISLDLNLSLYHDGDDGHCSDHIGLHDVVDAHVLFSKSET